MNMPKVPSLRRTVAVVALSVWLGPLAACGSSSSQTSDPSSAETTMAPRADEAAGDAGGDQQASTTTALSIPSSPDAQTPPADGAVGSSDTAVRSSDTAVLPVGPCKLPPLAFTNVGLGVPRFDGLVPSTGTVVAAVLFVDYDDAPAQRSVDQVFSLVSPGAGEFFEAVSYGRLRLDLRPHPAWLRLSQPSDFYGAGLSTFEGHRGFIQEAVSLADDAVDFGTADLVVVLSNPDAPGVGYGPAFGSPDPAQGIQADGVFIPSAVTSGADLPGWGPLWLNHEMGHTMTLPDLYAYDNDGSGIDEHRFVGSFGLMGLISGRAPEPFAFERWMLGWLDDSQVVCQTEGELTTTLDAVEAPGGTKAVVVPTGATTAVVIESRRAVGYDTALSEPGALVYTVDTSTPSGAGPIVVPQTVEGDEWKDSAPLSVGESLTVDGVTVSVVEAGPQGDTVLVSVSA